MNERGQGPAQNVLAYLRTLLPDLESVYKYIHPHPELSMQENRTAGIAADHLRANGYEVTTGVGKTGVVGPIPATLLGMLTGIGGGMVRDVLVIEIPTVLRTELYAVAALIGSAVMVLGRMLRFPSTTAAIAGAVLCFAVRFTAMRRGWRLPTARFSNPSSDETETQYEQRTFSRRQ